MFYSWELQSRASRGGGAASGSYSTSFPLTENPISEGSIWLNGGADGVDWRNVQTNGSGAFASSLVSLYDDDISCLKTSYRAFAANQYIQGVVSRAAGYFPSSNKHEIELLGRWSLSANDAHGYEALFGLTTTQAYIAVVKWLGPVSSYTPVWDPGVGSISPPADGDTIRFEISGTSARIYINGVKVGPSSTASGNTGVGTLDVDLTKDTGGTALSTWNSGQPGLGFWPQTGSTLTSFGWKSWQTGDL